MHYSTKICINNRQISLDLPTYFIADLAANHDGDIDRAKELIRLAKESGADAVKFQHFLAEKIVSDYGFSHLTKKIGHQSSWKKTVFDTYRDYQCPREWTHELVDTARKCEIDFFTTPYDTTAVDTFADIVPAFKIGSGDITWIEFIEYVAQKNIPVLLATGAATMEDVNRAVDAVTRHTGEIGLMQCNTNYTGNRDNFRYINLNVLKTYAKRYPGMVLGLSDHTPGHTTVLGAIALGARLIEKHFTDDNSREGPDHAFSMNPRSWEAMIEAAQDLESALGNGKKTIEGNETDTYVIQRRCLRAAHEIKAGTVISRNDVDVLRPSVNGAIQPYDLEKVLGRRIVVQKKRGQEFQPSDIEGY
jgi:N-acetylneuraminate synthase